MSDHPDNEIAAAVQSPGVSMNGHTFTLIATGPELSDELSDAFFDVGLDDALVGMRDAYLFIDLDREAPSLLDAVRSAITQVEQVPGVRVSRIEPDELVSEAEIAERTGRTRQSVNQLVRGERGPGTFPPPVMYVSGNHRIWRWADVSAWFERDGELDAQAVHNAHVIAALNSALALRQATGRLTAPEEADAVEQLARSGD